MCVLSCSVSHGELGAHGTCYSSVAKDYFYLICCHPFFCCETNKAVCHSICWLMSLLKMLGLGRRGTANSSHLFKFWRIPGNPFITGLVAASDSIFNEFSSLYLSMLHFQMPALLKDRSGEVKVPVKHSTLFSLPLETKTLFLNKIIFTDWWVTLYGNLFLEMSEPIR